MTLRYLLDTNVISEPLRPRPDPGVMGKLERHEAEIALPSPVWHELWFGCERLRHSKRRSLLVTYLRDAVAPQAPVLPYDRDAAAWHAAERARLTRRGAPPPFVDGQIAAIAAVNDLTLVTANTRDYAAFRDLRTEDWRQ